LPGCYVKYNGEIGIDHTITFNDKIMYAETKTCKRIVNNGREIIKGRPVIKNNVTLGKFAFKIRQHKRLVSEDGWYLFMVGTSEVFGVKANEITLKDNIETQRFSWVSIINKKYPDWLRRFKVDVYGI